MAMRKHKLYGCISYRRHLLGILVGWTLITCMMFHLYMTIPKEADTSHKTVGVDTRVASLLESFEDADHRYDRSNYIADKYMKDPKANDHQHQIYGKTLRSNGSKYLLATHPALDIVYTWVNGSDPELVRDLQRVLSKIRVDNPQYGKVNAAANRFEDYDQLRYSLRSVERFGPWVRHVYIVTNGQVPHWLNLENDKVTIVTHEEIFTNKMHLPTFNSEAIESHIHRIPNLSETFIYMNDDFMLGSPVVPGDFFSDMTGPSIYLSNYAVPVCKKGCTDLMLTNGICDEQCNVTECEWDAGECKYKLKPTQSAGHMGTNVQGRIFFHKGDIHGAGDEAMVDISTDTRFGNYSHVIFKKHSDQLLRGQVQETEYSDVFENSRRQSIHGRRLLDFFTDALIHVNILYSNEFGVAQRRALAHAPYVINKDIKSELHERYPDLFEVTSASRVRSSNNVQNVFAYFYYLMNARQKISAADVFDEADTDNSSVLAGDELIVLGKRLFHESHMQDIVKLKDIYLACSEAFHKRHGRAAANVRAIHNMSTSLSISRDILLGCDEMNSLVQSHTPSRPKYRYTMRGLTQVTFVTIENNIRQTTATLNRIRRKPTKFICLNDKINHSDPTAEKVKMAVKDFYNSMFPTKSKFERQ